MCPGADPGCGASRGGSQLRKVQPTSLRIGAACADAAAVCRFQWQVIDFNEPAIEYYKSKLGARERIESADAKWLNYIMDREALRKFLHPEAEPEPAA